MKFGAYTKPEFLPLVQSLGYDYYEGNLHKIATMSEDEYTQLSITLQQLNLPMYATVVFFGSDVALIGESTDFAAIAAYADHALARASKLGAKIAVLGSGAARKIPDGFHRGFFSEERKVKSEEVW